MRGSHNAVDAAAAPAASPLGNDSVACEKIEERNSGAKKILQRCKKICEKGVSLCGWGITGSQLSEDAGAIAAH